MTAALLKALRAQRLHWVEVGTGLRVQFARPAEAEMHRFVAGVTAEHVCQYVEAWDGFTEATLLGESVGSGDAVEFSRELWAEWVRDRADACGTVAKAIADAMAAHLAQREATAKN